MQLGWIDFSSEDRQKAMDVMNLLQEQGAVDELGIGIIRDAFANYFFPGTSTVQTRAKYFLIVPYLLKDAVDGRYGREVNRILRRIDEEEKECGITLMKRNPDEDGIIGKRVLPRNWVARKPSDIYWNGIRTYQIFIDNALSIKEYVALMSKQSEKKNNMPGGNRGDDSTDGDRDDVDAGDMTSFHFWNLPSYSNDWKTDLCMDLSFEEATFLRKQIIKSNESSLLAFILQNNIDVSSCDSFLTLTELLAGEVDDYTCDMMHLACDFSKLVYLARVRFNMILSEHRNEKANTEWDYLADNIEEFASVDLSKVFKELNISNSKTFIFLSSIKEGFLNDKIDDVDECIKKREVQLKGINRAKLNRTKEFNPDNWVGGDWLDYRFRDASRIINDIYAGEAVNHV
jgi:hypothetical protein